VTSPATLQDIADTIDHSMLRKPPAGLREFLASFPEAKRASDRRQAERYSVIADVIVVPLGSDLRPDGRPFVACSRNVSTGGMCLYHAAPVESTLLYVEIAAPSAPAMSALMKVLRQKHVGPYFEIAGQFLPESSTRDSSPEPRD
jgi:hypothetical protein